MKIKRIVSLLLVLTVVGSLLAACSSNNSESGGSSKKQELTMNFRTDPPALDVSIAESAASFTILGAVSEGLYRMDADNKPQPALAAALPEISADGLTYTIKLREGLKWADGSPLTAKDFIYSFRRTLDPATKATYSFMVAWIKGGNDILAAEGADAVKAAQDKLGAVALDETTLQITLEQPVTFFTESLSFLNFYPQKEEFVSPLGDTSGTDASKVLGAGPFVLQTWDHDQKLVLVKNDNYWDKDTVKLDKVTLNILKDNATGLNLYDSGASDYQVLDGQQYVQLKDSKELVQKQELTAGYLNFQQTKVPAFKNEKIRKAFAAAIDRDALVETILQGSTPATGFVPTGNLDGNGKQFREVAGDVATKFDVENAKKLLAEGMKEEGITAMPKLSIMGDDNGTGPKVLEFLAGQWEQNIGVKVDISPMPHATRIENELNKNYDIVSTLWGADYNDPMTWLDMFVTGSMLNTQDWSNAEYTKLITSAQTSIDPVARAADLVKAEKILLDEGVIAPLYSRTLNVMVKDKVQGMILPAYGVEFELKWTSIK
ncbi:MAG: peptide ABC transporter substrate-binding protein [Candidatus Cohnella colombiensis]|uniref:Peptide ABC transporter substrate-binding protein n=1 Tax=Candidatus Cohnella colombiensis TaxID=3121368 RepID=A0AA95JAN5_9BACL|nr:MAG: peptide ABC transporter substrate-binding protein [Cohnella sp.]